MPLAFWMTGELLRGVLTSDTLLAWLANGGGDAGAHAVEALLPGVPRVVSPNASVSDGVIAMSGSAVNAVAITADGTKTGRLQAIMTSSDLAPLFGEHPADLLRGIRRSGSLGELRELNQRARALTLEYLTTAAAVDWLATLTHSIDVAIVGRILALSGVTQPRECWCFAGSSGRGETLTRLAPHVVIIADDSDDLATVRDTHRRVLDALAECDYLAAEQSFEPSFYVAHSSTWKDRYSRWLRDPVMQQTYRARTLFDLRPVLGRRALWDDVGAAVTGAANREVLHVLANDCLASLPPLTFYQDAVVDQVGEHARFPSRGERASAARRCRPRLRDRGRCRIRVFDARSTRHRAGAATRARADLQRGCRNLPRGAVAAGAGRHHAGHIRRRVAAALLSRNDRHVLKSGFRSILDLLEFTGERAWLENL